MSTAEQMIGRLREIAERLGEPGLASEEAEALAREAAELVAHASVEVEAELRDSRARLGS
jgi:hypothetical protein